MVAARQRGGKHDRKKNHGNGEESAVSQLSLGMGIGSV
jgi:hypothetical protein